MARAHFRDVITSRTSDELKVLSSATVYVYQTGTTTAITETIFAAASGSATLSNPLTSDSNGVIEFWLAQPQRVDLAISVTGYSAQTVTVDVEGDPALLATSGTPSTQAFGDAATLGTSAYAAPLDHKHGLPVPGMVPIAETVLSQAAASISFSAIAGTYSSLWLLLTGRGDAAELNRVVSLRFNDDAGTEYVYIRDLLSGSYTSASGTEASGRIGSIPAASAMVSRSGVIEVLIPHYAKTTFQKHWQARNSWHNSAIEAVPTVSLETGLWRSTAAITKIDLLIQSGNFVAGTVATLYGLG